MTKVSRPNQPTNQPTNHNRFYENLFRFSLASILFLFTFAVTGVLAWQHVIPRLEDKLAQLPFGKRDQASVVESPKTSDVSLAEGVTFDGGTVSGAVTFQESATFDKQAVFSEGLRVGTSTLTINRLGAISTNQPITVSGVEIIGSDGKIPAITSDYFTSLDATKLTGKFPDADHLDGISSSSFLRSDESDTAEGAINFTAKPGGSGVGGGPVYINPGGATAGYTLLGVAVNGSQRFKVDAEGDVFIEGDLQFVGAQTISTSTGNLTIDSAGTFVVSDAAQLDSTLTVSGTTTFNGVTYTWPSADGTNAQVLQTNGSGTLSWATASTGAKILKRVSTSQTATTCGASETTINGSSHTISGGSLGTNKGIRVIAGLNKTTVGGTADTISYTLDLGGTNIGPDDSSATSRQYEFLIYNRDSASSQVIRPLGNAFGGTFNHTASVDTSSDVVIAFECKDQDGTNNDDTVTLELLVIEELGSGE